MPIRRCNCLNSQLRTSVNDVRSLCAFALSPIYLDNTMIVGIVPNVVFHRSVTPEKKWDTISWVASEAAAGGPSPKCIKSCNVDCRLQRTWGLQCENKHRFVLVTFR